MGSWVEKIMLFFVVIVVVTGTLSIAALVILGETITIFCVSFYHIHCRVLEDAACVNNVDNLAYVLVFCIWWWHCIAWKVLEMQMIYTHTPKKTDKQSDRGH